MAINNHLPKTMEPNYIQTHHPTPGKVNKRIALAKYNLISETIQAILRDTDLTHTELMERCTIV